MKKIVYLLMVIGASLILFSCEDQVELDVPEGPKRLVIDGSITSLNERQSVILTQTTDFNDTNLVYIQDAVVKIIDDEENEYTLSYQGEGLYETAESVQGVIGKSYTLVVQNEGKEYRSSPVEMQPVPAIDSVRYYFSEQFPLGSFFDPGYYTAVEFADDASTQDFYRWRLYVNDSLQTNIIIDDDENTNGVTFAEDDFIIGRTLRVGDSIQVEQIAITRQMYEFLDLFNTQANNSGGLFDTPPAPVLGNMYNVNDNKEVVLGFFGAENIQVSNKIVIEDLGFEIEEQ
ncbi:MAG: DUF4249 domain-containing protein [Cytophagales bacterium]|nr:DUF4249 domain-containing protein [Cytophagales bacterium]